MSSYLTAVSFFDSLSSSDPDCGGSEKALFRLEVCLEYSRQRRDAAAVLAARSRAPMSSENNEQNLGYKRQRHLQLDRKEKHPTARQG